MCLLCQSFQLVVTLNPQIKGLMYDHHKLEPLRLIFIFYSCHQMARISGILFMILLLVRRKINWVHYKCRLRLQMVKLVNVRNVSPKRPLGNTLPASPIVYLTPHLGRVRKCIIPEQIKEKPHSSTLHPRWNYIVHFSPATPALPGEYFPVMALGKRTEITYT